MVTSKHNEDKQYIWESNGSEFTIAEDPRGASLLRGTTVRLSFTNFVTSLILLCSSISLFMKDEAQEFLDQSTLKELIRKYSQFINFPIYMWDSKTETVEEPIEVSSLISNDQNCYHVYMLHRKMKRQKRSHQKHQRLKKKKKTKKLKLKKRRKRNPKQKR